MKKLLWGWAAAAILSWATAAPAAQVSFSKTAPKPGPNDISNLTCADSENDNVDNGDHEATYIADDRPVQGQTFTTGTNAAGYQLQSVVLREVPYDTYALVPDLTYTIRITKPSGSSFSVIAQESATVPATTSGNFSSIGDGGEMGMGSGGFITFTLSKPVQLQPNTIYGFDISGGRTRHYWQTAGTVSDAYKRGEAYSIGINGKFMPRKGDHVFVATLVPASAAIVGQAAVSSGNEAPNGKTTAKVSE